MILIKPLLPSLLSTCHLDARHNHHLARSLKVHHDHHHDHLQVHGPRPKQWGQPYLQPGIVIRLVPIKCIIFFSSQSFVSPQIKIIQSFTLISLEKKPPPWFPPWSCPGPFPIVQEAPWQDRRTRGRGEKKWNKKNLHKCFHRCKIQSETRCRGWSMGSRLPPSPPGTWWTKSSGGNFFIGCPVLYLWYLGTLWTRYLVPVIKFENVWTEAQDICFKGCQNHKRCWVLVSIYVCNYTTPPKGPQGKGA